MEYSMEDRTIDSLRIGDYCVLRRTFSKAEFRKFRDLSGDNNLLHHDEGYAQSANFEGAIVPVFMSAGPISAIAGGYLPGHRSLILKYSLSAKAPIFYDEEITYSAKITAKNMPEETLTLGIVAFSKARQVKVVLSGEMLVKVRRAPTEVKERWLPTAPIRTVGRGVVLIVGATSALGEAIARRYAGQGRDLVLVYFNNQDAAKKLQKELGGNSSVWIRKYSALKNSRFRTIPRELWYEDLDTVVYTLSSPWKSSLVDLMDSNYRSLRQITEASLPVMLEKQAGKIIAIGTSAVINGIEGLEDYVAAKTAAAGYLRSIGREFEQYGVLTTIVAPDAMKTMFSDDLPFDDSQRMLPEQVAEEVLTIGLDASPNGGFSWVTAHKTFKGDFGFAHRRHEISVATKNLALKLDNEEGLEETDTIKTQYSQATNNQEVFSAICLITSKILKQVSTDISELSGVGQTPGWDSLKQIEILLAIEKKLGISFPSSGFNGLLTVQDISEAATALLLAQSN
jgi:short-subunit dehydrogenase/acyl carrier protein/acyl dehydratase